jgi:protein-S-isoprenylcysteine O-methyltransferase Ste14
MSLADSEGTTGVVDALELRVPPVALVILFAAGMAVVAYTVPAAVAIPARVALACALGFAGALIASAGVIAFRRHSTTVNPFTPEQSSALVATGIYRFSRNPMYLGLLLALCGWSVFLANWASAMLLPAFVAYMNRFQIRPEERALAQKFGPQFLAYCESVRRWL